MGSKNRLRKFQSDPAWRAAHAIGMRKLIRDPIILAKIAAAMRKLPRDPRYRTKITALYVRLQRDPTLRAKHTAGMRKLHREPAYRAKVAALWGKLEPDLGHRAKQAAAMRKLNNDPVFRAKRDWLPEADMANLLDALRAKRSYVDVANDWLLSVGYVRSIARKNGLSFPQPRLHKVESRLRKRQKQRSHVSPPKMRGRRFQQYRLYRLLEDAERGIAPAREVST
ncbi:hypothetical protein [Bradyrhizobium sp. RT4b]|uniref:hypothetical protein n=1 Tax=unclassified Bradyrhizobium TaxID=2631580 RepID=UPI00339AB56D